MEATTSSFSSQLKHLRNRAVIGGTLPLLGLVTLLAFFLLLVEWGLFYALIVIRTDQAVNASLEAFKLVMHPEAYLFQADHLYQVISVIANISHFIILGLYTATFTAGLLQHRQELLKGRKEIVIKGKYYLVLGWNEQIYTLVKELILAHSTSRPTTIAVLSSHPMEWMQSRLLERIDAPRYARIMARNGSPRELFDIQRLSPEFARSIIVLPTANDVDTFKTIMALSSTNTLNSQLKVVCELNESVQIHLARIIAPHRTVTIYTKDVMVRLLAQISIHAGLYLVYEELFGFNGAEIYFKHFSRLSGKTFGEVWSGFEHACLIGIRRNVISWKEEDESDPFKRKHERNIVLFPPSDYVIQDDDKLIFIGEDFPDIKFQLSDDFATTEVKAEKNISISAPHRILILGWNKRRSLRLLKELDAYSSQGATFDIMEDRPFEAEEMQRITDSLAHASFSIIDKNPLRRSNIGELRFQDYDQVILTNYSDRYNTEEADMKALSLLVHVRDIIAHKGATCNLVSHIDQPNIRSMGRTPKFNDFILSRDLISKLMVQLAINAELEGVYEELFDAYGCEIQLQPITHFIVTDRPIRFLDICLAAYEQKAIALGYCLHHEKEIPKANHGIYLNPHKNTALEFEEKDRLIILVER